MGSLGLLAETSARPSAKQPPTVRFRYSASMIWLTDDRVPTWPWQHANYRWFKVQQRMRTNILIFEEIALCSLKCIHNSSLLLLCLQCSHYNLLLLNQKCSDNSVGTKEYHNPSNNNKNILFTFLSHSGGILIPHMLLLLSSSALRGFSTWLVWQLGAVGRIGNNVIHPAKPRSNHKV